MLNIGRSSCGGSHDSDDDDNASDIQHENITCMAHLNSLVEKGWEALTASGNLFGPNSMDHSFMPESIWEQWLWHEDPMEEAHIELLLNRMQLLGLMIARFRAAFQQRFHAESKTLRTILDPPDDEDARKHHRDGGAHRSAFGYHDDEDARKHHRDGGAHRSAFGYQADKRRHAPLHNGRLWLFDNVAVKDMTLRQLRDSVQNLQVHWNVLRVVETVDTSRLTEAVDALFHRFGVLASQAWPAGVMNDQGSIESCPPHGIKMNRICIRRFVNVFHVFHRHIWLWNARQPVTQGLQQVSDCGIKIHHIVAAADDFSQLSMYWDLMPAAKLNYVHDFRGYFNCISQVVYFHNQEYERRPQERKRIQEVSKGMEDEANGIQAVQIIPPLMQLYPEIEVQHADETSSLLQSAKDRKWVWLFAGRTVYLVAPAILGGDDDSDGSDDTLHSMRVIHAGKNIASLLSLYLSESGTDNS